jgi:dTDP-4-dehydrorhamnose reductase
VILVFGKTGQVARELARLKGVQCLPREVADLSDPGACVDAIRAAVPSAVINAAAYTAVDKAEGDEVLATLINGDAPGAMAVACAELGIPFVSISTDYVFDGSGADPWKPEDAVGPLGAYGRSKLAGEQAIARAGGAWAVLRTSWVVSAHGNNFVRTMLRLGRERDSLNIVADQIGGPTCARDIAITCVAIANTLTLEPEKSGVFHFSGQEDVSWADFAREIFIQAGITCTISGIPSSDYPTTAVRPLNSRLDCSGLETVFSIQRPDWRAGLANILKELGEN